MHNWCLWQFLHCFLISFCIFFKCKKFSNFPQENVLLKGFPRGNFDLNEIPYDYTVEVKNRFKRIDLIDRVPDELWMEVNEIVQETGITNHPQEKEMQKSKMAVWGGLTNSCDKKRSERHRKKGKLDLFECRVPKNSKKRLESLLQWSMQRNRGKQQNGKD